MKTTIKEIEKNFKEIQSLIAGDFSASHLEDSTFLSQLNDLVSKTYIHLNEGICEELEMCHTCALQRDLLQKKLALIDDLDAGATLTDKVVSEFADFKNTIDDTLSRIDTVLKNYN